MIPCILTLIAATLALTSYLYYVVKQLGYYPKSISQSYYDIPKKNRWMFLWALIISGGALITCGAYIPAIGWTWPLLQLAGGGIVLVAGASQFHTKGVGIFHYIGAIGGFLGGLLSFGLCYGMWYWSILMILAGLYIEFVAKIESKTWWLEIVLVVGLILGIAILLV